MNAERTPLTWKQRLTNVAFVLGVIALFQSVIFWNLSRERLDEHARWVVNHLEALSDAPPQGGNPFHWTQAVYLTWDTFETFSSDGQIAPEQSAQLKQEILNEQDPILKLECVWNFLKHKDIRNYSDYRKEYELQLRIGSITPPAEECETGPIVIGPFAVVSFVFDSEKPEFRTGRWEPALQFANKIRIHHIVFE